MRLGKIICSIWLPSGDVTTVISKWPAAAQPGRQAGGWAGALAGVWVTWVLVWNADQWLCGWGKSLLRPGPEFLPLSHEGFG